MDRPARISVADWNDRQDRADLALVRRTVFIEEQHVPEELEWDGLDEDALLLIARDTNGWPIGTARMLADGHIGRMAVLAEHRGAGVGTALLRWTLEQARSRGLTSVYLDAQVHAISFYERLGFVARGDEFMDAGIPHRRMARPLDEKPPKSG